MKKLFSIFGLSASLAFTTTGCGKQEFVVTQSTATADAPGFYTIPAKVDVLLAVDDTGSMSEVYGKLQSQFGGFLDVLEKKGWNYRMIATPLTQATTLNQIMASKYDPNWGSQWKAPFPGASMTTSDMVLASFFTPPSSFAGYNPNIVPTIGASEPGLQNISQAMTQLGSSEQHTGMQFLRPDALLAVIVVGNGQDTSGVNYCVRPQDGVTVPCNDNSAQTSLSQYQTTLRNYKQSPSMVKFYAAISKAARNSCLGGPAYRGDRYEAMASALGGASYDVCVTPFGEVLNGMASHLESVKKGFRTRYIMLSQEPEESTLQITKYNSDGSTTLLDQSPNNGYTYSGKLDDAYTIDAPVAMNRASGYAVELHGAAKLIGDETASITFLPKGASNSK